MKVIPFEQDEYIVMAMFDSESRQTTIRQIEEILPFIQDDTELVKIVTGTIEKMKQMPDAQFAQLDLEPYRKEDGDE